MGRYYSSLVIIMIKKISNTQTITKEKISLMLKEQLGFSALLCEEITNTIFVQMLELSLDSDKLVLPNFGRFKVVTKGKRPGMNMHTGMPLEIKPRKVLRFNASTALKEMVNSYDNK